MLTNHNRSIINSKIKKKKSSCLAGINAVNYSMQRK